MTACSAPFWLRALWSCSWGGSLLSFTSSGSASSKDPYAESQLAPAALASLCVAFEEVDESPFVGLLRVEARNPVPSCAGGRHRHNRQASRVVPRAGLGSSACRRGLMADSTASPQAPAPNLPRRRTSRRSGQGCVVPRRLERVRSGRTP